MKKLLAAIAFLFSVQVVSAQSSEAIDNKILFRITVSESDASNAKSLKALQFGNLVKGESRTTFIVSTSEDQIPALEQELKGLFPSVSIDKEKPSKD